MTLFWRSCHANKLPLSSQPSVSPIHSFLLIFCLLSSPAHALEMRTVVKDFVTTEWTLECPDGEVLDLTTVGLTDQGIHEFIQCLSQIESEVGVHITHIELGLPLRVPVIPDGFGN